MAGSIVVATGSMPANRQWRASAFGAGVFCAVASGPTDRGATSTDGLVWTERTLPASRLWLDIAYGAGVFCAVAGNSTSVATSATGASWSSGVLAATSSSPCIAHNGVKFCIVDLDDISTSTDGLSWTVVAATPVANVLWQKMIAEGGVFYAIGTVAGDPTNVHVIYSADGVSWTDKTGLIGQYGSGIASNGSSLCATSELSDAVNISVGLAPWTQSLLPAVGTALRLASDGIGFLGLSPGSSDAVISPDGFTWETHAIGSANSWMTPSTDGVKYVTMGFNSATSLVVTATYPLPVAFWTNLRKTQETI